jgi:uncharacterized protein YqgC (DUF456 family)
MRRRTRDRINKIRYPHGKRMVLLEFIVGGSIIAGVSVLIHRFNPLMGTIVWSLPWTLLIVLAFMWWREGSVANGQMSKVLLSAVFVSFNMIAFLLTAWWILRNSGDVRKAVVGGALVWAVLSVGIYWMPPLRKMLA